MKTVILSDIHLDASLGRRDYLQSFVHDLPRLLDPETERLILLGDLFDFWFEYRHVIFSGYFDVLRMFAGLQDRGIALHLVCGNHDFWAGRFLRDHLQFEIHAESLVMNFGTKRVLMLHGDGLNNRDLGYRLYKRLARAKPVIGLFGLLHPDLAMAIARRVSRTSRRINAAEDPMKGSEARALAEYAGAVLARGEADVVLAGHAHAPVEREYPNGLYINTGDWMYHRSFVTWDGSRFKLNFAPLNL